MPKVLQIDAAGHYRHGQDVTIAFLPFFHIYGITAVALLGLWSGATLVVVAKFELESYLDLVERYRATVLHVVPPVVVALADELMTFVAGQVAPYKKVRRLEFVDAIPKSPSGKILRRILRERPPT